MPQLGVNSVTSVYDPPYAALSSPKTPQTLAQFRPVATQRFIDPFPEPGSRFLLHEQRFPNFTSQLGAYTATNVANTGTATLDAGGLRLAAGASGWNVRYTTLAPSCGVAPFLAVRLRVETLPASSSVRVGIYKDANNEITFQYDGAACTIQARQGGTLTSTTLTNPAVLPTGPFTMVFTITDTSAAGWFLYDSGSIDFVGQASITSLATTTEWASWVATFGANLAASVTGVISYFSVGYVGGIGSRDYKWITYADGTPYTRDGLYYATATLAAPKDYTTNHQAIISVDPRTWRLRLVSHLFYTRSTTDLRALYGGQAVYDPGADQWTVLANNWGDFTGASAVDLYYAQTTDDLLTKAAHLFGASVLLTDAASSVYDGSLMKDSSGTWWVSATNTSTRTAWSTFFPALYSGVSLVALTRQWQDTTNAHGENGHLCKVGGVWYVITGVTQFSTFSAYKLDGTYAFLGSLWRQFMPNATNATGAAALPVCENGQTRYVYLGWDNSTVGGTNAGTGGGAFIMRSDDVLTGFEWPNRRLLRAAA